MEAWRRLHGEYDPTSSMRRVAVLQQVQNPPRCQRVEDLGSALEDWLSKKCQNEILMDRDGRPCQASDDSLVAVMFRLMPKSVEVTVMCTNEDEGFQELFDRLLASSRTKQSVKMSESKRQARRDDPMDVDALSKGKVKAKGKKGHFVSGKGNKSLNHMSNVRCWICGRSGHCGRDCRERCSGDGGWHSGRQSGDKGGGKSKGGKGGKGKDGKGKCKLNSVESSNWQEGWLEAGTLRPHREQDEEHVDQGWWKTADEQTAWEPEEPVGGFEISSVEPKYIKRDRWGRG